MEQTKPAPLKKTFETYWTETEVILTKKVSFSEMRFFQYSRDMVHSSAYVIVNPTALTYRDLTSFLGKKTRLTIEVIE